MEEVSLELLKAKLPNLNDVMLGAISTEYALKFCYNFPSLNRLDLLSTEGSHNLSLAISSLQNLRELRLPRRITDDQIYTSIKNLPNLEVLYLLQCTDVSLRSFRCVAQMQQLRNLSVQLEALDERNLDLFTNLNHFPELKRLIIFFPVDLRLLEGILVLLQQCRPTLDVKDFR